MSFARRILTLALALTAPNAILAQPPARPAITGIAFARFYATDPAAAQKFYGDTLGFAHIQASGKSLYPVNRSQWLEVVTTPPPQPNNRLAAVAYTTRNAAQLQRYLAAHKIMAELPLKDGQFGVRDPEGNLVLFVQSGSQKAVAAAPSSASATSTRIIHVGFIVHDRNAESAFWQDILGFRPYWHGGRTNDTTDWVALQVPDGSDWLEYMLNSGPNPSLRQTGVMDHFSLGVAHMQDAIAALARNHCGDANCSKTQIGLDGKVQFNLFDPDLSRVEFMEFVPTQPPCCSPFTGKHPNANEDQ